MSLPCRVPSVRSSLDPTRRHLNGRRAAIGRSSFRIEIDFLLVGAAMVVAVQDRLVHLGAVLNAVHCAVAGTRLSPSRIDDRHQMVGEINSQSKSHRGEQELDAGVGHLDVVVLDQTAGHFGRSDRQIELRFVEFDCGVVRKVFRIASEPIDDPPAEASGSEAEDVFVRIELADLEVEANDEGVPGRPDQGPDEVGDQVVEAVLIDAEDAEDDEYGVEEVCQNWNPHESEKIKDLSFDCRDKL